MNEQVSTECSSCVSYGAKGEINTVSTCKDVTLGKETECQFMEIEVIENKS